MSWTKEKPVFDKNKDYIIVTACWDTLYLQFNFSTYLLSTILVNSEEVCRVLTDLTYDSIDMTVEDLKADLWHVVETPPLPLQ